MQKIIEKIKQDFAEKIVEVFWIAIKAAVVTFIILLILKAFPIEHNAKVRFQEPPHYPTGY